MKKCSPLRNSRRVVASVLCAATLLSSGVLWSSPAQAAPATKAQVDRITAGLTDSLGASGVKVLTVEKVEFIDGLFEVAVSHNGSKKILYTNASGSHILLGDLIESKSMANLTQSKAERLNAINFDKDLPANLALKSVTGTGSRKIAVFEDPNCSYCKRFRKETLSKLQDATVYTYVFPVLGKDSLDKAQKLLCADNKSKAWEDWMMKDALPSGNVACNPPINELLELGRGLGVTGTPTIFFQDGTRVSGAILPSELFRRIANASR